MLNSRQLLVTSREDSGPGTLRQALLSAQSGDIIIFDPPTSPMTITLESKLPTITTDTLKIDASHAGVVLDGNKLNGFDNGLTINGANGVIIQGLQIINFPGSGIQLINGARNTVIGGSRSKGATPLGQGNLLSHNNRAGISLSGVGTTGNIIRGNNIGTNLSCTEAMRNGNGIRMQGVAGNIVGGETSEERNVISGNSFYGIAIAGDSATGNEIRGNYIGTNCDGTKAIGNGQMGVFLTQGATSNVIGGTSDGARNIISGNNASGIFISSATTNENKIIGNYIGTTVTGMALLGNGEAGITIQGASQNTIGGTTPEERNIISGNTRQGVLVQGADSTNNYISANYIGTDETGSNSLSNGEGGLALVWGAQRNFVGGETPEERNIISGNMNYGIRLQDDRTTNNYIRGNYIGTKATGSSSLENIGPGIQIAPDVSDNVIGGPLNARNLISGNKSQGILLNGTDNQILENYIGSDSTGEKPIPNNIGVEIDDSDATGNVISNTLIAFNRSGSVLLEKGSDNVFQRNVVQAPINGSVENQNQWALGNFLIDNKFENFDFVPVTGGTLTENETWEPQGDLNTYMVVENDLVIASGVTLTITPGVNLQVDFGLGIQIESGGVLIAEGSADLPIRFTSAQRFANPLIGDWQGLTFAPDSVGSLHNTNIEFATNGLTLNGGDVSVYSSTITASQNDGILVPTETDSLTLTLVNNTFAGNGQTAINNQSAIEVTAPGTWWGSASGAADESNPNGKGDAVSANVNVENWRTDPGEKDAWLTAPIVNPGNHHFIIDSYRTPHWFRIPTDRAATLTATLTHPEKDYDLFLFSNLEEATTLLDDIGGDMKGIGGDMKGIGGDMKGIGGGSEICSPRYIGQVANLGRANRGRLLRQSCDATIEQEVVSTGVWDQSGWYYLLVAGHNGANDPNITYTLSITLTQGVPGLDANFTPPLFDPPESSQAGKKSLIVTHRARLEEHVDEADQIPELMDKLDELANQPEVAGVVIDLDTYNQFNGVYNSWDENMTDPVSANYVAASIKALLTSMRGAYPDLENILIVGNDQIIPFHRIPDEVTIANERTYRVDGDPVLTSNLREGYFLSDDYYAGFTPIPYRGRDVILPEYAIGRLVETPEEMITAIDTFLESPVLTVTTGLVTGYDFLIDQADAIADQLGQAGVTTDTLISYSWQADQLKEKWLNTRHDLSSINAHFEHGLALPAERDGGDVSATDVQASENLTGTVVFSVGCHSGLPVSGSDEGQLDFAQVLIGRGAMYVGNTGYGYGDANAIGYSEDLMRLFVRYLRQGTTVGQALRQAKSEYFNTTGIHALTPYDEKVLGVATFYGFPMYQVRMPNDVPSLSRSVDQAPSGQLTALSNCPEGLTCREAVFSPVYATHPVTDGTYFSIERETQEIPGQPILPRTSLSVLSTTITNTLEITVARGVLFEGGQYETFTNFDPVITRIVTESTDLREQELPYLIDAWRPAEWERINSLRIADKITQRLVVTPLQYHSTTPWQGTARRFTDMSYTVYYSNTYDSIPPSIWAVQTTLLENTAQVYVDVTDFSEVVRTVATYTTGSGEWKTIDMDQIGPNIWETTLPQDPNLAYFVQAVDGGGNVAIHDNKGRYFSVMTEIDPPSMEIYLPIIIR
ncbi:MAG: hypothetical protein ACPGWR_01485 [Ardenticatenaceae bacterium]